MRYTRELLDELLKRDKSELLGDYNSVKLNRDLVLNFKCNCGETYKKGFRSIKDSGFFCKRCTEKNKKTKIKATNIEKYGVETPMQSKEVKDKIKATNLEKYGVENPMQNTEVKDKIKATNLEKYGAEHPMQNTEVKNKSKATNIERRGVEYPFQSREVKDKIKATNIEKYGVENPSQNAEVSERASKTAYKSKEYSLPSGKSIKVQGKENIALDELLLLYNEDEVITSRKEVPKIWWEDKEGKKHRYFADIFIPKESRIIEIKSIWTFSQDDKTEKIEKVPIVATEAGYKYEYWIYDNKDNKKVKKFY